MSLPSHCSCASSNLNCNCTLPYEGAEDSESGLKCSNNTAEFYLHRCEDFGGMSLRNYRKVIVSRFLIRIYRICGFRLDDTFKALPHDADNEDIIRIRRYAIHSDCSVRYFQRDIRIGKVILKGCDAGDQNAQDITFQIYKSRILEWKQMNKANKSHDFSLISLENIVRAVVNWEFLSQCPSTSMKVVANRISEIQSGPRALFYNFIRVTSVLATFEKRVQEGIYPPLPHSEHDRSFLLDEQTFNPGEADVLNLFSEWSRVCHKILRINDPFIFTQFILKLNEAYENYYSLTHILMPLDAKHHFHKMHRNIYVYQHIRNFMLELLDLLILNDDVSCHPIKSNME